MTVYELAYRCSIPDRSRDYSFVTMSRPLLEHAQSPIQTLQKGSISAARHGAWNWQYISIFHRCKNVLNFTSTSLYVFMAQCWLKSKGISLKCNCNFGILKLYFKHLSLNEVKYFKIKFIQWTTRICPDIWFQDPDLNLAWSNLQRNKEKGIKEK